MWGYTLVIGTSRRGTLLLSEDDTATLPCGAGQLELSTGNHTCHVATQDGVYRGPSDSSVLDRVASDGLLRDDGWRFFATE